MYKNLNKMYKQQTKCINNLNKMYKQPKQNV